MQVVEQKIDILRSDAFQEKTFSIKANAKAFAILSSGLYSNKIRACVRELSTNAADAHVSAGKGAQPFSVHLPNKFEPHFTVKDYGIGLSQEDIQTIYTTYFESTKTQTNDLTGCLGLGSKSPFSYTDNFSVVSYFNGMKYIYSAFISEAGFPSIALMHSEETSEANGLEVGFAVKPQDFDKFLEEANYVYKSFKVRPIVTGRDLRFTEDVVLFSGPGWSVMRGNEHCIVMGNVSYPINMYSAGISDNTLTYYGFKVEVPIGDIEMTASRESLEYTEKTKSVIKKYYDAMIVVFKEMLKQELENKPSLWEASIFYSENHLFLGSDTTWHGQRVRSEIEVPSFYCNQFIHNGYSKVKMQKSIHVYTIKPSDKLLLVEDDLPRGGLARVREYMATQAGRRAFVLRFTDEEKEDFFNRVGEVPANCYIKTSMMPKPASSYSGKRDPAPTTFEFVSSTNKKKSVHWEQVDDFDIEEGGVYVELENWTPVDLCVDKIDDILSALTALGRRPVVYGLRKKMSEKVKNESDWLTLKAYAKKVVADYSYEYDNVVNRHKYCDYTNLATLSRFIQNPELTKLISAVDYVKKNMNKLGAISKLMYFADVVHESTINVGQTMEGLLKKYPLIFYILENVDNVNGLNSNVLKDYVKMVDNDTVFCYNG